MRNKLEALKAKLGQFKGAVIAGAVGVSSAAMADPTPLDTALDSIQTAATTGISSVQSHTAVVVSATFGLILLGVGARWLYHAVKGR